MERIPIIAGNWKMHKTVKETREFIIECLPLVENAKARVYIAPPFTSIWSGIDLVENSNIRIGAQNISEAEKGAFTGEVSAEMIKELGGHFVILGHSERRQLFKESSSLIARKMQRAIENDLVPILCIGELQEERDAGEMEKVLTEQIMQSLQGLSEKGLEKLILAYEPVWAIGTGKTATPEMAEEAHLFCRNLIKKEWGEVLSEEIPILYGGSVKPENISSLMKQPNIDGALVGGASLDPKGFAKIVNYS